jgi:hypothetical protein
VGETGLVKLRPHNSGGGGVVGPGGCSSKFSGGYVQCIDIVGEDILYSSVAAVCCQIAWSTLLAVLGTITDMQKQLLVGMRVTAPILCFKNFSQESLRSYLQWAACCYLQGRGSSSLYCLARWKCTAWPDRSVLLCVGGHMSGVHVFIQAMLSWTSA